MPMAEIGIGSSFMFESFREAEDRCEGFCFFMTKIVKKNGSFGDGTPVRTLLPSCRIDVSGWDRFGR
jgi:hypothetical protein